ncbi:glycosyl hydrolase family 28-related protein [Heyndrickxia sporothermodurans]
MKSLGAKGDGVTDDTHVIQNELNIAKTEGQDSIIFPEGRYKVAKTLIIYKNTYLKLSFNAVIL